MDLNEVHIYQNIEKYGCHIFHILEENDLPGFSYSIGIEQNTGHPEIIVTGLKQEFAHQIINDYNYRIRSGRKFIPGKKYNGFLKGFEVVFKKVEKKYYSEYFGYGRWYYKSDDFTILQLIYPNKSGLWPWDNNVDKEYLWFIPKLYAS
jgi:Domain of unknown function (DUF4262)